jgi:2-phosphoglycerate kinase
MSEIIIVSGGTGVGTSKISLELARNREIDRVFSTDIVREVIKSVLQSDVNVALESSTYLAGKTLNYDSKSEDVQKSEILRAYKTQSRPIIAATKRVIQRALHENISMIVEGVHICPGKLTELLQTEDDRVKELFVIIDDEKIHRDRFYSRAREASGRRSANYLNNFREIRWIQDYLESKAVENGVQIINNQDSLDSTIKKIENVL